MSKSKHPTTNAIRRLREADVDFEIIPYDYQPRGGTKHSSAQLGVDEHLMVKTLIMETETGDPLIVLMHGDYEVSTKKLARLIGVKSIRPCEPKTADKHSGYFVGGTSPIGTKRVMPVYAEESIFKLDEIYLNAGHRGLMLRLSPASLHRVLDIHPVQCKME